MRIVALAALVSSAALASQLPRSLQSMRNHYRPLLVFDGGQAELTQRQRKALEGHDDDLRQRQILLVGLEARGQGLPGVLLAPAEQEAARKRFGVAPGEFTVILIGKDGGEKLRSHQPLSWETLQQTVDAMPMRQQEMKER